MLDALERAGCHPRHRGDHADARCPAHDDRRPSLTADWRPATREAAGRVLLQCHAGDGCTFEDIVAGLGLAPADTFDGPSPAAAEGRSSLRRIRPPTAARPAKAPARRTAAPKPGPDHRCRWEQVTTYPYVDELGTVLARGVRERCAREGCGDKRIRYWRPAVAGDDPGRVREGWVCRWPERRPLYLLPDVLAAAAAGEAVYVVEGEKDAEALAAAGVVATCNLGGAGKWRPEHTEALAGARVVIVADRDEAGYRHAVKVRAALEGVAAAVAVVEAAAGKDAADHLDAGHAPAEFVAIDAAERLAALAPAPAPEPGRDEREDQGANVVRFPGSPATEPGRSGGPGGGGPGGGTGSGGAAGQAEPRRVRREFRVIEGRLCEVPEGSPKAPELLGADVRLLERRCVDMADPDEELTVTHARLVVRHPEAAEPWESTVEWDDFQTGKWVKNAPWPLPHDDTAKGRATLYQAVVSVSDRETVHQVVYGSTGWRERAGRPVYVHAAGAIDAGGHAEDVPAASVRLPRALERYALPPTLLATPAELRAAFDGAVRRIAVLERSHIAAPAIALPFRTVLGWLPSAAFPTGPRGQGKTAWLAWAVQFFAPATRYDSSFPRPSFEHTTRVKLYLLIYAAQHSLLAFDDGAPDKGPRPAQEWAAEYVRTQFNGSHREISSRDGQEPKRTRERARGAGAMTAEQLTSNDSADSRPLFVPIEAEDDAIPGFAELDRDGGPVNRARVLASFVSWVARAGLYPRRRNPFGVQLDAAGVEVCDEVREFRAALTAELAPELGPAGDGAVTRLASIVADYLTGAWFLLRFLRESGAYSDAEAAELWAWLRAAMVDLGRRQDATTEARSPAERLLRVLRSVLTSGAGHLLDEGGGQPADALALGWEPSPGGGRRNDWDPEPELLCRPRGRRLGARTAAGRVHLDPTATAAEINDAARAAGEPLDLTHTQMAEQLDAGGYLRTTVEDGRRRRAPKVRLFGAFDRMWDLSAAALLGEDEDQGDAGPGTGGGVPALPPAAPLDEPQPDAQLEMPAPASSAPASSTPASSTPASSTPASSTPASSTPASSTPEGLEGAGQPAAGSPAPGPVDEPCKVPAPAQRPAQRPSAAVGRYTALGVAVDADGGWLIERGGARLNGVDLPERLDSLADLLEWAEGLRLGLERWPGDQGWRDDGQVWVMPDVAARLGLPVEAPDPDKPPTRHRALAAARDAGWKVDELRSWTRAYRPGVRGGLDVAVVGWMPPAEHPILTPLPGSAALSAPELSVRLGLYVGHIGMSYRLNAGITGVDLTKVMRRRKGLPTDPDTGRLAPAPAPPKPGTVRTLEEAYLWQRPATAEEAALPYVHAFDVNAAHLAAAGGVELGLGAPRHIDEPCDFDRNLPGYWRLAPGTWEHRLLPDLLDPAVRGRRWSSQWFTTPTVRMLRELDYAVEPMEAYVWDEHTRFLDSWAERLRDARASLLPLAGDPDAAAVLAEVKFTYVKALGLFGQPPKQGAARSWRHQPYWWHAVVAQARATLTRKLHKAADVTGRHPLAIATDCVVYASEHKDPAAALPDGFRLGHGLGEVKWAGSARMAEVVESLGRGRRPDGEHGVFEVIKRAAGRDR